MDGLASNGTWLAPSGPPWSLVLLALLTGSTNRDAALLELVRDEATLGHLLEHREGCVAKLLVEEEEISLVLREDRIIDSDWVSVHGLERESCGPLVGGHHCVFIIISIIFIIRDKSCRIGNEMGCPLEAWSSVEDGEIGSEIHGHSDGVVEVVPLELGEFSLGDELGTIFQSKLFLPLLGPLLGAQECHGEVRHKKGVLDLEGVDFSLIIFKWEIECPLGSNMNPASNTFEKDPIHRLEIGEQVLVLRDSGCGTHISPNRD